MPRAFFVSDLHGQIPRYEKLWEKMLSEAPEAVFFGGDLFPHDMARLPAGLNHFSVDYLRPQLEKLKAEMNERYPAMLLIPGNDDARAEEDLLLEMEKDGLLHYLVMRKVDVMGYTIAGYPFVPPTPFLRKDWEKYDVSRYVDPGCVPPTEGHRTKAPDYDPGYDTIAKDLQILSKGMVAEKSIFLFHSPPYQSKLDRAALDHQFVDHVPLDVHVGSIAIQRFLQSFPAHLSLHGHIHESSRLTGHWKDRIGETICLGAAWDGPELALISFDTEKPEEALRLLI
jgi:Icc-related predicted phosphoesterase